MGMKIIKVAPAEFEGEDGSLVKGKYVYLVPVDHSGQSERVFLSDTRLEGMEYSPKSGDTVYIFKNGYGRVMDMVRA